MTDTTMAAMLQRSRTAPPVRIVHLGLGAFSRSHLAWYTAHAADAQDWGIAAYTGRSAGLADALTAQDGLYTLIERSESGDRAEVIESIVRAHPGSELDRMISDIAAPETAIVSLTITEAGYLADDAGRLNVADDAVSYDLALFSGPAGAWSAAPRTALGRLVAGLDARRRAGGGPLALLSLDNLPDNGGVLRRTLHGLTAGIPETRDWILRHVSFVSASVDRITPRVDMDEQRRLQIEYADRAPVLTEPFRDWVISGTFPAGRPHWETAGARFTDDLEPWEARKLWMLNGAHTLLANLGPLRGSSTVAEAINDPACRAAVAQLWDEDERYLPDCLDIASYRSALLGRFENPRIVHRLDQIAADTPTKLRLRIVPVAERERAARRDAPGCATAIAAWIASTSATPMNMVSVQGRVAMLSEQLSNDEEFIAHLVRAAAAANTRHPR